MIRKLVKTGIQMDKVSIEKIIRSTPKAHLCLDHLGNEGWINRNKFPDDGMIDFKYWNKQVKWVKNKKGGRR